MSELQPLQPKGGSSNENGQGGLPVSKSNLAMGGIVVAVLVLYFGFPTSNTVEFTDITKKNTPLAEEPAGEEIPGTTVMYRPFCIHHGADSKATVKLLQTSFQNPSKQWSLLPCYHESKRPGRASDSENDAASTTFGAPDASLAVNFSSIAFPQRKTPILGFGGAFTEASALNFHSLEREGQEAVLELLFGKTGLGYSKGRVHINSCDFSVESYSFDETEDDFDLNDFDTHVTHDVEVGMVDLALRATSKLREAWSSEDGMDGTLRLYASPWSPPAWMKEPTWQDLKHDKNAIHAATMVGSAEPTCIRDGTSPESLYAKAWALYFSKFLTACKYQDHFVLSHQFVIQPYYSLFKLFGYPFRCKTWVAILCRHAPK